jgi:hypothetical protein
MSRPLPAAGAAEMLLCLADAIWSSTTYTHTHTHTHTPAAGTHTHTHTHTGSRDALVFGRRDLVVIL